MRLRAIFLVLAFAVITTAALAQSSLTFPALTGRVVDDAGILDANTRATLEQLSTDLEAKSNDQLVVVTLKSLQGTSIDDYGYQLGRHWQIGQKGNNNGVLLIVAPNERKVRIEVGYGLEGTLTDLISNFIIQNSILPRFRAGDFPGGITRGAQDISQVLMGDADEYKQRATQANANAAAAQNIDPVDMLLIAFFVFMMITTIWNAIANMRRPGGIPAGGVRRTSNWGAAPIILGSGWGGGGFGGSFGGGGGGFSGGGGSFGGGGSSGSW